MNGRILIAAAAVLPTGGVAALVALIVTVTVATAGPDGSDLGNIAGTVPGAVGVVDVDCSAIGPAAGLTGEQPGNAAAIVTVALQHGFGWRGAVIGVMTAVTESSLIDVDHGDSLGPDSRRLFQQRNSWGPLSVRMDPAGASGLFFDALQQVPGRQGRRGWRHSRCSAPSSPTARTTTTTTRPPAPGHRRHGRLRRSTVRSGLGWFDRAGGVGWIRGRRSLGVVSADRGRAGIALRRRRDLGPDGRRLPGRHRRRVVYQRFLPRPGRPASPVRAEADARGETGNLQPRLGPGGGPVRTRRPSDGLHHAHLPVADRQRRRFGWIHPTWADPGHGREEPWHWEYTGTPS